MEPMRLPVVETVDIPPSQDVLLVQHYPPKKKGIEEKTPGMVQNYLPNRRKFQDRFNFTKSTIEGGSLNTVCEEARCPNIHDCWGRGTATFMIAGEECTRGCRFCAVGTIKTPLPLDPDEPIRLANAIKDMALCCNYSSKQR